MALIMVVKRTNCQMDFFGISKLPCFLNNPSNVTEELKMSSCCEMHTMKNVMNLYGFVQKKQVTDICVDIQ